MGALRERTRIRAGQLTRVVSWVGRRLVLEHVRGLGVLILGGGLLLVLGAFLFLIWLVPAGEGEEVVASEPSLNTIAIDQLELWIEEVEEQRRAGTVLPTRPIFVTEDLKAKEPL